MNPLLVSALGSLVRWVLAFGAGWLVNRGVWTEAAASEYLAAGSLAVVAIAWSVWQKYRSRIKFLTALEAPAGTDEEMVDVKISRGTGATLAVLLALGLDRKSVV